MTSTLSLRAVLVALALLLIVLTIWSLATGSAGISLPRIIDALLHPGAERADHVLWQVRLPRVVAALAAGSALAVAGAIMQAMTGNPLAEPGLLGVNAGAAFAVVATLSFTSVSASGKLIYVAFAGAALAAALVHALGSAGRGGATPIRLVLAGVVTATFLGSLTSALLILNSQTFDTVRLWTTGSLKGRQLSEIVAVLPYLALSLAAALSVAGQFTTMSLGGDRARSLGQSPLLWRGLGAALVVGLAGSAVAIAGPVGFVGLVVPHMARLSMGTDYRRILPVAALGGAGLMLAADTLPRALAGRDLPVGVTMALVGAPFFIWLARNHGAVKG